MNSERDTDPSPSVSACACRTVASSIVVPVASANSSIDNWPLSSVSAAIKCSAALTNSSCTGSLCSGSNAIGSGSDSTSC